MREDMFLEVVVVFCIGCIGGWILEFFFRKWFSEDNPEHKWENPGFCRGPWLPIYGFGLTVLYFLTQFIKNKLLLFLGIALAMTLVELVAGVIMLKFFNLKLWDYSNMWGNFMGLICPLFSFFWMILGIGYYEFLHEKVLEIVGIYHGNVLLYFFLGVFYGIFVVDVCHSAEIVTKLKKFAKDNEIVIIFEDFKKEFRKEVEEAQQQYHFFNPFRIDHDLKERMEKYKEKINIRLFKRD
ncbi:MAG: putative ABC transporter permease [Erysipelotrichaceae bacterium]|nr:putative ABC transporter permease [Erysipelotrichaceae bacterium]